MNLEEALRAELASIRVEQKRLAARAGVLTKTLSSPKVRPVLCFWEHHSYCEEPAVGDTLDEAFGELDGMEEHGTASSVGVRVGGYLVTWKEWSGELRLPWDDDLAIRRESDERHRKAMMEAVS